MLQGNLGIFSRLLAAGFPAVDLLEQNRYAPTIATLLLGSFYNGDMTSAPGLRARGGDAMFRSFASRVFGVESNVFLVDVAQTREVRLGLTKSKINPKLAAAVQVVVDRIVNDRSYNLSNVAVITPYAS